MKKMIKLPLFLGIVGGLCGAVLAITNIITAPKIAQGEEERTIASYKKHFPTYASHVEDQLTTTLSNAGVNAKILVKDVNNEQVGTIYKAKVSTYGSQKCNFTVSFKGEAIHKIVLISNEETNQGKTFVEKIATQEDFTMKQLEEIASETGSTYTFNAINKCINVCYSDYLG